MFTRRPRSPGRPGPVFAVLSALAVVLTLGCWPACSSVPASPDVGSADSADDLPPPDAVADTGASDARGDGADGLTDSAPPDAADLGPGSLELWAGSSGGSGNLD